MLEVGARIGSYRIVRQLGEGGMGAVFEAVNDEIARKVAIKVLHPQYSRNQEIATRFLNEARAANIVDHPGIVEILDFGRLPDGTTYIVMELLKGDSLRKQLEAAGKLSVADTLRLGRQIASALAAAHAKGIVHRDLKPDNVVIAPDAEAPGGQRAKVLDFGIAKVAEEHQKNEEHVKTRAGSMLGTPIYMSPEQCRGADRVTDKADVYSLGVMFYHMLAGAPPFDSEGMGEILAMHLYQEPKRLDAIDPSLPAPLVKLVHAMMAKEADPRPSMAELVGTLEQLGATKSMVADAVPAPKRSPLAFVLAGALVIALAGGGAFFGLRSPPKPPAAPRVHWSVTTDPPGADVLDGSQVVGKTPWLREQDAAPGDHVLTLHKPGFFDKKVSLDGATDATRAEKLLPIDDKQIKILE